ncbi:MAG: efflux RND transporter periplasmic adaptor subunit [Planctomycetota bacterium]|nr:efflux RND transporter periplasmic adaptor subunit [Planctomycetota bacterium]
MSAAEHDTPEALEEMLRSRRRRWLAPAALGVVVAAGGLIYAMGALPKREARAAIQQRAEQRATAPRRVVAVEVRRADEALTIRQPATLEPIRRALILAQVGGYLSQRRADVGDRVTAGQVLGVVATPVLEKELTQALSEREAALAEQVESQQALELAERTATRLVQAGASRAAAEQEVDDAQTQVRRASASVKRASATVEGIEARIESLRRQLAFGQLIAPFDGVVTRRTRELGDYIEVGGNITDPPVFTVVDSSSLRTVVSVPQALAYLIRTGQEAIVRVAGVRDLVARGTVTRISGELDQATRTMPIEVELPNADGRLLAGSYATVEIQVARPLEQRPALIPGNALMLLPTPQGNVPPTHGGSGGPTVGVLRGEGPSYTVEYRSVRLGRDFGSEIEILSGVEPGERVILNVPVPMPPETLVEVLSPQAPPASRSGS